MSIRILDYGYLHTYDDSLLYGEISNKEIIKSYQDLKFKNETLPTMTLNTILANKLGLLTDSTRNEPRDLFDIWFLLNRTHAFSFDFNKVCKIFEEKYSFNPTLSILLPFLKNRSFRINWDLRLNKQIATLPHVDLVIKDIQFKLEELFGNNIQ